MADRDGQLRVANMNLETMQKQGALHAQEVARYEESLGQLHGDMEKGQEQYKNCHNQVDHCPSLNFIQGKYPVESRF